MDREGKGRGTLGDLIDSHDTLTLNPLISFSLKDNYTMNKT